MTNVPLRWIFFRALLASLPTQNARAEAVQLSSLSPVVAQQCGVTLDYPNNFSDFRCQTLDGKRVLRFKVQSFVQRKDAEPEAFTARVAMTLRSAELADVIKARGIAVVDGKSWNASDPEFEALKKSNPKLRLKLLPLFEIEGTEFTGFGASGEVERPKSEEYLAAGVKEICTRYVLGNSAVVASTRVCLYDSATWPSDREALTNALSTMRTISH